MKCGLCHVNGIGILTEHKTFKVVQQTGTTLNLQCYENKLKL